MVYFSILQVSLLRLERDLFIIFYDQKFNGPPGIPKCTINNNLKNFITACIPGMGKIMS